MLLHCVASIGFSVKPNAFQNESGESPFSLNGLYFQLCIHLCIYIHHMCVCTLTCIYSCVNFNLTVKHLSLKA